MCLSHIPRSAVGPFAYRESRVSASQKQSRLLLTRSNPFCVLLRLLASPEGFEPPITVPKTVVISSPADFLRPPPGFEPGTSWFAKQQFVTPPEGFEPPTTAPKAVVISISPQGQIVRSKKPSALSVELWGHDAKTGGQVSPQGQSWHYKDTSVLISYFTTF